MSALAVGKSYAILGALQSFHGAKETWKSAREKTREVVGMEKTWDLEGRKEVGGGGGKRDGGREGEGRSECVKEEEVEEVQRRVQGLGVRQ